MKGALRTNVFGIFADAFGNLAEIGLETFWSVIRLSSLRKLTPQTILSIGNFCVDNGT